jgi:DNA-binding XRE family transcriptional regulator
MLAQHIRNKRKSRKLTQAQAAVQLGVTRSALSLWEKGAAIPQSRQSLISCWLADRSSPPPTFQGLVSIAAYQVQCGNCLGLWTVPRRLKTLHCTHCGALNSTGKS